MRGRSLDAYTFSDSASDSIAEFLAICDDSTPIVSEVLINVLRNLGVEAEFKAHLVTDFGVRIESTSQRDTDLGPRIADRVSNRCKEVRTGVMATYETAARHLSGFNSAVRVGNPAAIATQWGAILGLTSDPQATTEALYVNVSE